MGGFGVCPRVDGVSPCYGMHGRGTFQQKFEASTKSEFLQVFGRQQATLMSLSLFALGSALCGSAKNMNWLIAARGMNNPLVTPQVLVSLTAWNPVIQGAGGGGLLGLSSIIISDLVPLRERAMYNSVIGVYINVPHPLDLH